VTKHKQLVKKIPYSTIGRDGTFAPKKEISKVMSFSIVCEVDNPIEARSEDKDLLSIIGLVSLYLTNYLK
jgi:hypothetical protein